MILKDDITNRINADFGEYSNKACDILQRAIEKTDYLNSDRVIRCIIFLAKGNIDELNKCIKAAIADTRDIMLWAEYEITDDTRLRDFNHSFEENANDTIE